MQLPGPIRAAIGLAANVVDEARHLPDRAIELPMLAVSSALQLSLRAQQRYAGLAARGDQVLSGARVTDDPPAWATFDDPVPTDGLRSLARDQLGDSADATALIEELFGPEGTAGADEVAPGVDAGGGTTELTPPTPITAARSTATGSTPRARVAKSASAAGKATKATTGGKRASTAKKAKVSGAKVSGAKASGAKASGAKVSGKRVSKPRHTAPSKFDDVGDDA